MRENPLTFTKNPNYLYKDCKLQMWRPVVEDEEVTGSLLRGQLWERMGCSYSALPPEGTIIK